MLKLVVSNEVAGTKCSEGLGEFHAGAVLERPGRNEQILVLACGADCKTAMLMPLPDGDLYEARVEDMKGWSVAYLPGPRLVEVRRRSSKKIEWSSYVPDLDAAVALWQKLERAQPRDFDVEIHTQHVSELEMLDDIGYFDRKMAQSR